MPLLSFIIPFYNAEKTIYRTLDSIYNSGLKQEDFEVIIIDDCSNNPINLILSEKIKNYPNLRIARHAINKKQGGARNTGIRMAEGRYIAFVDADDEILPSAMDIVPYLKLGLVDILACRYLKQDSKGAFIESGCLSNESDVVVSGKQFCENLLCVASSLIPCCYLYSKEFLYRQYQPFVENVFMEDADWVAKHLFFANKVLLSRSYIFKYYYSASSTTNTLSFFHISCWVKLGIRKIVLSKEITDDSPVFSRIIEQDGRWNIEGAFTRLWKSNGYRQFYRCLNNDLSFLRTQRWSKRVSFFIYYPVLSCCILYILGSIAKVLRLIKFN